MILPNPVFSNPKMSLKGESQGPPSAGFEMLFAYGVKEFLAGLLQTVRRLIVAEGISDLVQYRKA